MEASNRSLETKRLEKLRTSDKSNHTRTRLSCDGEKPKQRHCVWCCGKDHITQDARHYRHGRKTSYTCSTCNVNLCIVVRKGEEMSCFEEWHCANKLNDPCKQVLCSITNESNSNNGSKRHQNAFPCRNRNNYYNDDDNDSTSNDTSKNVKRYPKRHRK